MRTKNRSVEQLTDRVRLICGDLSFDVTVYGQENDGCGIKFTVFYSALEKKLPEATELVAEILTETVFDQENTVLDLLRQEKTQNLEGIVMGGHQIALCRVGAQLFAHRVAQECVDGFYGLSVAEGYGSQLGLERRKREAHGAAVPAGLPEAADGECDRER